MTSIGETLRQERVKNGLELEQISANTKISVHFLHSIENDQFSKLPGGVFAKSFVRQYARYLGLDEQEILSELGKIPELAPPETVALPASAPKDSLVEDIRVPGFGKWKGYSGYRRSTSSLPAFALVVVVMLVCSAIYGLWQKNRHAATLANREPAVSIHALRANRSVVPTEQAQLPGRESLASNVQSQQTGTTAESVPLEPAKLEGQPPAAVPLGVADGALHIQLLAQEPTWISASLDGKHVYSGLLQPNDTKLLNAVDTARLVVGNAGGLQVSVNGKPVGPLGKSGQVRVVRLSPDTVQIVPRTLDESDSL